MVGRAPGMVGWARGMVGRVLVTVGEAAVTGAVVTGVGSEPAASQPAGEAVGLCGLDWDCGGRAGSATGGARVWCPAAGLWSGGGLAAALAIEV
jgi:hypothetical protein